MNRILILVIIFIANSCYAQEKITYFNENGKPVKEKEAVILQQQVKLKDTLWEFNYYYLNGPMFISMQAKDEKGKNLNGRYIHYDPAGNCDSLGNYSNGRKEGRWLLYLPGGSVLGELTFKNGILTGKRDSTQMNEDRDKQKNSIFQGRDVAEVESEFPGAAGGWNEYLSHHMKYPDRAVDREVQGTCDVFFIVDTLGRIDPAGIWILHSVEWSIDKESLRLIRESPNWIPSMQDGKALRSYKKQPFYFKLTSG